MKRTMNCERRQPCVSCPYRKDAKLAFWHADHFTKLLRDDKDLMGPLYQCHEDGKKPANERGLCVGWMLDQKRRDVPAVMLRLKLSTNEDLRGQFEAISEAGLRLFSSVADMCRANLRAIAKGKRR